MCKKLLIIVNGGIADYITDDTKLEVDIFDVDNWNAMDDIERNNVREEYDNNPEWKEFLPEWVKEIIWE